MTTDERLARLEQLLGLPAPNVIGVAAVGGVAELVPTDAAVADLEEGNRINAAIREAETLAFNKARING